MSMSEMAISNGLVTTFVFINGLFCCLLLGTGLMTLAYPARGSKLFCWVFGTEMFYFLMQFALSSPAIAGRTAAERFGTAIGVGGVGTYVQFFSGFTLWGFVLAFLANRRFQALRGPSESSRR
jgi:hypothetical protein